MGRDASSGLKSTYTATENSYNIEKIVLQVVLPVFCVSSSRCCGFVWSLPSWYFIAILFSDYYTFQLTKIKALIRLHGCAGCSVPSFFACNQVRFPRSEVPYC